MPPAPPGYSGPRFDHFCADVVDDGDGKLKAKLLDTASAEGWELVSENLGRFCFKRPRP